MMMVKGFEGVVALALTLPSGCALEGASVVQVLVAAA